MKHQYNHKKLLSRSQFLLFANLKHSSNCIDQPIREFSNTDGHRELDTTFWKRAYVWEHTRMHVHACAHTHRVRHRKSSAGEHLHTEKLC